MLEVVGRGRALGADFDQRVERTEAVSSSWANRTAASCQACCDSDRAKSMRNASAAVRCEPQTCAPALYPGATGRGNP